MDSGDLRRGNKIALGTFGVFLLLASWHICAVLNLLPRGILPSPIQVLQAQAELVGRNHAFTELWKSFKINIAGCLIAVVVGVPVGFILGLNKHIRAMFEPQVSASRYLPFTATMGVFIAWFGSGPLMKIMFLACGTFVYIVPATIQRINEVRREGILLDTLKTLGATKFQLVRHGYIPLVMAKLNDDIRTLLPITWTYIIAAELVRTEDGGVGALIGSFGGRIHRVDKQFGLLIWLLIFAVIQDQVFLLWDRFKYPHKHIRYQSPWRRMWRWKKQTAVAPAKEG